MPDPVHFPSFESRLVDMARRTTRLERRPLPYIIVDHHKIFGDRVKTKVRARAFAWTISDDVADSGLDVIGFRAYVTTTGGDCSLNLFNETTGGLLTALTIPSGAYSAYTADTIDECENSIEDNDRFVIETTVGGGTKGLGVYVFYGHDRRP